VSDSPKAPVALVTGGNSGIGRATAIAFAKAGAKTIVADLQTKEGGEVVESIRQADGEAVFVQTDVSKLDDVKRLIEKIVEIYGRLDWACNNAGIEGGKATITDCPEELWDKVIDINLKGVWLCMKYEIPEMLKGGGGAIVNISSANGFRGAQGFAPYTASKHGVIGLTKSAAKEYAESGIRINTVCPGSIHTPMVERLDGGIPTPDSWRIKGTPMRRIGSPEEIANAVLW
jgi:NAD(P)-dependent dehydrogenase (short-subunit alcohol dehydrogenase family)